ncbi:hypothetical protein I312_105434 [Cryptococcus bacillisporus CA1280]|uniref:uncharacterized protein n=1 Tax=Cryptococcus bacillisporus CA1280 TaxID=1296109 RepID=UPI003367D249
MPQPFLTVKNLTIKRDSGSPVLGNLSLDVSEGEVLVIRGASGSGKSTLLKFFPSNGYSQLFSARKASQEAKENETGDRIDPMDLAADWGIEKTMWRRNWDTLSGGEAQRVALALAVGIGGAEVLLLDEPTSALDEEVSKRVERSLIKLLDNQSSRGRDTGLKALVWITHSAEQAERVATRTFDIQLRR